MQLSDELRSYTDTTAVDRFCCSEEWTGDLANGLFVLGKLSIDLHGLENNECGLLTLLRCYDPSDRTSILELLENASSGASAFCFSTHIVTGPSDPQPVICIGESIGFVGEEQGRMNGIFIYPRIPGDSKGH